MSLTGSSPGTDAADAMAFPDGSGSEPAAQRWPWRRWRSAWRRWSLWTVLVALVVSMLITLVWLAGRYEAVQVQDRLERDAANAVADIRVALNRNLQDLQALSSQIDDPQEWRARAAEVLQVRREILRIEWRDARVRLQSYAETPYRPMQWEGGQRDDSQSHAQLTCANAPASTARRIRPATSSCSAKAWARR